MPVRPATALLRCSDKRLWRRRMEFYVGQARAVMDMSEVSVVGIDETSSKRGQNYITVVHDLERKRLLFATEGRDSQGVQAFVEDLEEHGGQASHIKHACVDMSAAYIKGISESFAHGCHQLGLLPCHPIGRRGDGCGA